MIGFLGGHLEAGVDIVLETVGLESRLEGADLVITGEGSVDYQTVYNKAPIGVARLAKARGIPVVAIAGSLGERHREVHDHGIDAVLAITSRPMTLEEASAQVEELVTDAAEQATRMMAAGKSALA